MKRMILSLFIICSGFGITTANVVTFTHTEDNGYTIAYQLDEDSEGTYLSVLAALGTADTLLIPETVEYNNTVYTVRGYKSISYNFDTGDQNVGFIAVGASTVILPKTLKYRPASDHFIFWGGPKTQDIHIAENNPHFVSQDGVLYTADMDTLLAVGMGRRGRYDMPEGVKVIGYSAFFMSDLDTLNMADSVEELEPFAILTFNNLHSLRYSNSLRTFGVNSLGIGPYLEEITLGSGLKDIGNTASISGYRLRTLYCLAPEPPELKATSVSGADNLTLFVPRASINLYEAHPAWGLFPRITAIEPPIVSGINEAEVTWVSNADATGYSWELYLDEERTMLVMRLTFARDGRLLELEFNSELMSSSSPAPMRAAAEDEDGEHSEETTERQFTTYFSFTVKSLSPNTQYYYTRKTYGETGEDGEPVVIDEEQSDFTTLSDTPTSLSSAADAPAVQKVLRNGSVYILNGDETYTLTGAEVK